MKIFNEIKQRIETLAMDQVALASKVCELANEDGMKSAFSQQTLSKYLRSSGGKSKHTVYILEAIRFFEAQQYPRARLSHPDNRVREFETEEERLIRLFRAMSEPKKNTLLSTAEAFAATSEQTTEEKH